MKPQYTIATNQYGHYCIPLSSAHRLCAQRILAGEVHEPDTIQFILDNCGDGDVIHAGAYFGDMLPALERNVKGNVYVYEPNPENFKCTKITGYLNNMGYHISKFALGEKKDEDVFIRIRDHLHNQLGGGSQIVKEPTPPLIHNQFLSAISTSIDDEFLYQQTIYADHIKRNGKEYRISIIHLDIEGSEQLALTGAMDTITRCKPILILETLPNGEWIDRNLAELGYKITGKVHSNTILECVK